MFGSSRRGTVVILSKERAKALLQPISYVRHLKDGQSLDVNGNVVPKNTPEAHIPLEDFAWPF